MFSIDCIVFFTFVISFCVGLIRGFYKEFLSSFFWFFNFYFLNNYYYFSSFYENSLQNIFFKKKFFVLIIIFFFIIKKILNCFLKRLIKKINLFYINVILGGFFGIFRGVILVLFFLFVFKYLSLSSYNYYVKNSIFISIFFDIVSDFFEFFNKFLKLSTLLELEKL